MRMLDLYNPPDTAADRRAAILLDIRAADGEWLAIKTYKAESSGARWAAMRWKRHCRLTKWEAFEWKTHGTTLFARFVGTRMVAIQRKATGGRWTGTLMTRRPRPARVVEFA